MRFYPLNKIVSPFWQATLFLVLLPILELFLLLHLLGTWFTLLSMLLGGVIGTLIARKEGIRHWIELNQLLDRGESPTVPILNGMLVFLGVLLMILPGLVTCLFGLFLLFPLTRFLVVTHLVLQFDSYRLRTRKGNTPPPDIIDV